MLKVGLDIGSTTIKCVVMNQDEILYENYERHFSHIKEKIIETLSNLLSKKIIDQKILLSISGSAGMGFATKMNVDFTQEVYATKIAVEKFLPNSDCVIELGGEDAKILFLNNGLEVRMNGTCAGGTGAFIDQMATLLNIDVKDLNDYALKYEKIYPIASRCGVFAKSDIQPLLNQGARINDIAASIFLAVVNQTIGGLAQGREIHGNVVYLGGPLTFFSALRKRFDDVLNIQGIFPSHSLFYVAIGSAINAKQEVDVKELLDYILNTKETPTYLYNEPLFDNQAEYEAFLARHQQANVKTYPLKDDGQKLYLGIDSGSTTLKMVLMDEDENIRFTHYQSNQGNPVFIVKKVLIDLFTQYPNLKIAGSCSTGYGEELIKNAFLLDDGIVETMAHYHAAKKFKKDVDFVIDIGGQDIKCFKIENGIINDIFLNEACSSGCGSFLQTFANALGYDIEEFAKIGLFAKMPVDLGSRCTVFMNSSVKQAQKDGATIDNISAGLCISVVKNALYKVIRTTRVENLGKNIVVQGGTFLNPCVLRAFEKELKINVTCPNIAGLMGAYGAALHAKSLNLSKSTIISLADLKDFSHQMVSTTCQGCFNHCSLTVNRFKHSKLPYISGNQCEKPLPIKNQNQGENVLEYIRSKLLSFKSLENRRGDLAIPLVLNMYELYPFYFSFFSHLGFHVVSSGLSDSKTYALGQNSIPSDTVCYPAKLVHGHIQKLISQGYQHIFYPCMSYNVDEYLGDNHYNCPIVAYYPQTIKNNMNQINTITFIDDFISLADKKVFKEKMHEILSKYYPDITQKEVGLAADFAYGDYEQYLKDIRNYAQKCMDQARKEKRPIIILAGRPYHLDPQVNHGIDKVIANLGACVVSEECVSHLNEKFPVHVLNQWTFHSRLYSAAKYATKNEDVNLIQLVSFGCGLDAITADECKEILQSKGKIYTQIKIDEISNLGTIKIRLRSLLSALNEK